MQAAAKQFRGDFFVAIDTPVGKFVRIEAPFLNGDVGVRGDAIAMPAVRNGRKGLVIRLVKLDADSLGIPIQEATKELSLDEEEDDPVQEFDAPSVTVASGVSAAVAKSIRAASIDSDRAQPVKPVSQPIPKPVAKSPSQPTRLEDLDDDTREAVNEFGEVSTKASALSADLAKKLSEPEPEPEPAPAATPHTVRRTPEGGVPIKASASDPTPPPNDDVHQKPTTQIEPIEKTEPVKPAKVEAKADAKRSKRITAQGDEESEPAPSPPAAAPSKTATTILVVLILLTIGAAAFVIITSL